MNKDLFKANDNPHARWSNSPSAGWSNSPSVRVSDSPTANGAGGAIYLLIVLGFLAFAAIKMVFFG